MTLEEAIEHCIEIANKGHNCVCGEEHEQLAEWLRELQHLRERRWEGVVFGELPPEEQARLRQAHEDGKTIQVRVERGWMDVGVPVWNVTCAYRIKPEPEIEWVTPTDADCPCRCQVRDEDYEEWKDAELRVVGNNRTPSFFARVQGARCWQWWAKCRIRKEQ